MPPWRNRIAHWTSNPGVAGSSPAGGTFLVPIPTCSYSVVVTRKTLSLEPPVRSWVGTIPESIPTGMDFSLILLRVNNKEIINVIRSIYEYALGRTPSCQQIS